MEKVLIVEDDISFCALLETWFKKNSFQVSSATDVEKAQQLLSKDSFSLLISDLRLPDGDGIELLEWIKEKDLNTPVIMLTSYAEIQTAVRAMKLGAFDFLEKPINPEQLKQKVYAALSSKNNKKEPIKEKSEIKTLSNDKLHISKNATVRKMYEDVRVVAPTQISVMILGQSGTGKEHIARLIHDSSQRKDKPFIAVDCGVLSKDLVASELFGHLKGAFTSALSDKKGVFEGANGGTIFFDEVGNLPYEVQVQLLRVLQERKVRAVGDVKEIEVDVRVISATNENLETAILQGRFREDLFHRLNEFTISVPALRERKEDIIDFANHFIALSNIELNKEVNQIDKEAQAILLSYNWSGNLRELKNVIRRAVLFCDNDIIRAENLPSLEFQNALEISSYDKFNEAQVIKDAIERAAGNKSLAAKLLKIDRKTLYNKIHQYNIEL